MEIKTLKKFSKLRMKSMRSKLLVFFAKFLILSLPILFIVELECFALQAVIARLVCFVLGLFNTGSVLFNTLSPGLRISPALYVNGLVVVVDFACTGFRSFYLLFAF